ncbi:subtilisin family serine protease [Streptosporangium lutulentum]|uniref:Subtilisin family serine protease n=1 Tax=Streptosporangium lutulentum TaxID=1461250 RepID=A0ABT9QRB6_9ACTN|nr:S8 family serine peptidase [Streptosporangium lutulentum]MDP9849296.1 subtilisin family serine protease [Streptosporangium lutulentum]
MTLGRSFIAVLLAGTLGLTPTQGGQAGAPEPSAGKGSAGKVSGVTLITGDRVVVVGKGYRVEPGPGRQVGFMKQVREGHLYVIPSDARPLIAKGVLDRRLFDVTQLLAWRYGDADTADIPVITQSSKGLAPPPLGARQTRQLADLGMSALRVPKASAAQTWKDLTDGARTLAAGTTKLWLDGRRSFTLDQSVKQIGATEAWKQGMTGKGVTVAVLDSGYDPDHPDLKGVVAQERNFSEDPDIRDAVGHGTHVASTVAGAGEKYRGVAPDAKLAIGKVGSASGLTESAILAGMEWAAVEVKARVVNMSFGTMDTPELDPVEQAVNSLSERTGTLFVVAAGNGGGAPVNSPGGADAALTVGAVDREDRMAPFSSTGPREGDHAIKPDVTAPGVGIVAAAAAGTAEGSHVAMSGTSMAAPHVVGAAAILAQRHPEWTGQQLKAALIGSAAPSAGATPYQQGSGRVDLVRALAQQVVAVPGNVWAAFPWNGPDERTAVKTITYANSGDAPLSLDLTAEGEVLKLSAQRIEVPAGGQASVTLTIDGGGKAPGDYLGTVTARSGETVIRTLAGAYVEPESYDVTVNAIGRDGAPVDAYAQVYDPKTGAIRDLGFQNGIAKIRLPKGEWNLYWEVIGRTTGVTIAHTTLEVDDADQQMTLDARQGKRVRITLDDPTAVRQPVIEAQMGYGPWTMGWTLWSSPTQPEKEVFTVPVRQKGLRYMLRTLWESKDVSPSPYVYDLVDRRTDGLPEDPTYAVRQRDLAKVTATYRASGVAAKGWPLTGPRLRDTEATFFTAPVGEMDLPGTLTHYRTPGLVWDSGLEVGASVLADEGRALKREHIRETWNAAVTGPSFARPGGSRTGDRLTLSAGTFFADGTAGRTGTDGEATGTATLTGSGQVIAKTDIAGCFYYDPKTCEFRADLPAEAAAYTLSTSMRRQVPYSTLSTAVDATWTFRSANTAKEQPLPLMAVRYAPEGLDDLNHAKPGSLTRLPMWIERNPGAPKATVRSLRLEMSSDDGASWHRIPAAPSPSGWTAAVPNPRTPGFVSLRVTVTDTSGAGLTQAITRAYAVG